VLRPSALVVLESTTYPATTEEFLADLLRAGSGLVAGEDCFLGHSPERIDPGNRRYDLVNTPKAVSGVNSRPLAAVRAFYDSLVDHTFPFQSPREAELTKLIEKTFRHVTIALVNELAMFAAEARVDIWDALEAASTKPFGFMRFNPGLGVGDHCLPIDPCYLSWHVRTHLNRSFRFVELANDINGHMPDYVVQCPTAALNTRRMSINGSVILVLGVAYKPNTSDMGESPALLGIERLLSLGAQVRYVDDHISESDLLFFPHGMPVKTNLSGEELREADTVVVLTDHDGSDDGALSRDAICVLDTRHRCQRNNVELL
jgi:UDP-N-acetyl-D-glucosamine dehydrogenase